MLTRDEQINRRIGRMEALASDLAGLTPGYQPTELEMIRAAELQAYLGLIFNPEPAPELTEKPARTAKPGKK
jgi:hypothetical protein